MSIRVALEAKKKLVPKQGFNVVGLDKFEAPGEELYLVDHYASRQDADKKVKEMKRLHPQDVFYVYGPTD